jgi:hypothetical protein
VRCCSALLSFVKEYQKLYLNDFVAEATDRVDFMTVSKDVRSGLYTSAGNDLKEGRKN